MRLAIIGYGKMGRAVEKIATGRGHIIGAKIDIDSDWDVEKIKSCEAAIEFSMPATAAGNILRCFEMQIPVVCGTTAWYDRFEEIKSKCETTGSSLLYAPNFSIGMNIFMAVAEYTARIMNSQEQYAASMEEIHHIHKLDKPSGTARALAENMTENIRRLNSWSLDPGAGTGSLLIDVKREGEVPGTHNICYDSAVDSIELKHTAKSRDGFALGAVMGAEWLAGRKGCYHIKDMLDL